MRDDVSEHLGKNVRQLRESRNLTQQQAAKLADLPRATWAHLETGEANPTLSVLRKVAHALQVTLEELVSTPRAACEYYPKSKITEKIRGGGVIRALLPDPIPGMAIDRITLAPKSSMTGVPHTPGTREYLTCESGMILLTAAGEKWTLSAGDVLSFRGDQKHAYTNPSDRVSIGYSVVVLAKV